MKLLTLILFSTLAVAQSPRTHQDAYALPNAPSASQPNILDIHLTHKTTTENPRGRGLGKMDEGPLPDGSNHPARNVKTEHPDVITVDDIKDKGFFRGHPTRTKLIIAGIGGAIGLTIALATRHNCPKYINGYRYDGTPPCPGKDYDPGGKSIAVRWRF